MQLKDSKTYQNLARAFSGECQAQTRYRFIEYGARTEGLVCLADQIDKIAYNEFNHARMLYTLIQDGNKEQIDNIDITHGTPFREKWDLTENLRLAALDEEKEASLYRAFKKTAEGEGFTKAATLFGRLAVIEGAHRKKFLSLYEQLKNGSLYEKEKSVKWVCSGCGYEESGKAAWDECPVCKAKQGRVELKI